MGAKLSTLFAREKSHAHRHAFVSPARRAGIEQMDALMHLIRGTMSVTVKKPVDSGRHPPGQDMDQVETLPSPLQIEARRRIEVEVVIAQNHLEFRVDRAQFIKDRFLANIAEMPDLIDILEDLRDTGNPPIVRVGNDADAIILRGDHQILLYWQP